MRTYEDLSLKQQEDYDIAIELACSANELFDERQAKISCCMQGPGFYKHDHVEIDHLDERFKRYLNYATKLMPGRAAFEDTVPKEQFNEPTSGRNTEHEIILNGIKFFIQEKRQV